MTVCEQILGGLYMTASKNCPNLNSAPELKRRAKVVVESLKDGGGEVGLVRILPDGTVEALDISVVKTHTSEGLDEWTG